MLALLLQPRAVPRALSVSSSATAPFRSPSSMRLAQALLRLFRRYPLPDIASETLHSLVLPLLTPPWVYRPRSRQTLNRRDALQSSVRYFESEVSLVPSDAEVWWWPEATLTEGHRRLLAELLRRLSLLEDPLSEVEVQLLEDSDAQTLLEAEIVLVPQDGRVLVPAVQCSLLSLLEDEGKRPEDSASLFSPSTQRRITAARFVLKATRLPRAPDTLPLAEHARCALLALRARLGHSRALTGKTLEGLPLEGHGHTHFLLTDEDQDGGLEHLTLYAADGFDEGDVEALARLSVLTWASCGDLRLELEGIGDRASLSSTPVFGTACRWRSVTPFSLPRFASRGAGKPPRPRDRADAQLCRELSQRGYPQPACLEVVEGIDVGEGPWLPWGAFAHVRPKKGTHGFGLAGFRLTFDAPVAGPLSVGFGCHFGLGLFLPDEERER